MFKMKSSSFLKVYFSDYGLNVIYTLLKAYFKHLMKSSFFLSFNFFLEFSQKCTLSSFKPKKIEIVANSKKCNFSNLYTKILLYIKIICFKELLIGNETDNYLSLLSSMCFRASKKEPPKKL